MARPEEINLGLVGVFERRLIGVTCATRQQKKLASSGGRVWAEAEANWLRGVAFSCAATARQRLVEWAVTVAF